MSKTLMVKNSIPLFIDAFISWGNHGEKLKSFCKKPIPSWNNVANFIFASKAVCQFFRDGLRKLVAESDNRFTSLHLRDPFTVDLTRNRWFAGSREEGYSDWLAWILMQLSSTQILNLLGIINEETLKSCASLKPIIERETVVEQGHEGQSGRTDILIIYKKILLINVEVKVTEAGTAELGANEGYRKSLEKRFKYIPKNQHYHRLLITDAVLSKYGSYEVLRWADLCHKLRQIILAEKGPDNLLAKAAIVMFVGAVEQTLLEFSVGGFSGNSQTSEYMELTLRR